MCESCKMIYLVQNDLLVTCIGPCRKYYLTPTDFEFKRTFDLVFFKMDW